MVSVSDRQDKIFDKFLRDIKLLCMLMENQTFQLSFYIPIVPNKFHIIIWPNSY